MYTSQAKRVLAHLGQMRKYPIENQFVFFDDAQEQIKVLNPVAVRVMEGVNRGLNEAQIVEDIHEKFLVDPGTAEADIRVFLNQADATYGLSLSEDEPYLPTTDYVATRNLHDPVTSCYHLPGFQVVVDSELHCLHALLSEMFMLQAVGSDSGETLQISVFEDGNRYPIVHQGRTLDTGFTLADTAVKCLREINGLVAQSQELIAIFHASAVSLGNKAVLMPASGGSGKSTLAAYLMHRGFEYINDDAVSLLAKSLQLLPVPVGLSIKSGSWPVLEPIFPQLLQSRVFGSTEKKTKYLAPLNHQVRNTPVSCQLLLMPQYQAACSTCQLNEVSRITAFETLMRSGCTLGQSCKADAIAVLLDWLSDVTCYTLAYSSLPDAEKAITYLLEDIDDESAVCKSS